MTSRPSKEYNISMGVVGIVSGVKKVQVQGFVLNLLVPQSQVHACAFCCNIKA